MSLRKVFFLQTISQRTQGFIEGKNIDANVKVTSDKLNVTGKEGMREEARL